MSEDKQTFVDPQTGQEIESTRLAQRLAKVTGGLVYGSLFGLTLGPFFMVPIMVVLFFVGDFPVDSLGVAVWGSSWLLGVVYGIARGFSVWPVHNLIARHQHFRRQRLHRSQEPTHVPDTALSRAPLPGEPAPTDGALSRADIPEGTEHLTVENQQETKPAPLANHRGDLL